MVELRRGDRGTSPDFLNTELLLSYFAASGGDPLKRYRQLIAGPAF